MATHLLAAVFLCSPHSVSVSAFAPLAWFQQAQQYALLHQQQLDLLLNQHYRGG